MEIQGLDELVVRRKCSHCSGEGQVAELWCNKCGTMFGPDMRLAARKLPCGHSAVHLRQRVYNCTACHNQGYTEHVITVAGLAQYIANVATESHKIGGT